MYPKPYAWQNVPSIPHPNTSKVWQKRTVPYPQTPTHFVVSKNRVEPYPAEDVANKSMDMNPMLSPKLTSENSIEDISFAATTLTPEEEFSLSFCKMEQDGLLDLPALIEILKNCNEKWPEESIWDVIKDVVPASTQDGAMVDCGQALVMFRKLMSSSFDSQSVPSEPATPEEQHVPHNRSMCYLMFTVVGVLLLAAIFIAGVSVMWLLFGSQSQNAGFLQIDLGFTHDMLQMMVRDEFQTHQEGLAMLFTQTVATLVEEMGYGINDALGRDALLFGTQLLRAVIEEWWEQEAHESVLSATILMGDWTEELITSFGLAKALELVDSFNNSTLPDGHEILLMQWADPSNNSVRFLTNLRFKDECPNDECGSLPITTIPINSALAGQTGVVRGYDYRLHMVQGGFMYLPSASVGLVYKVDIEVIQGAFVKKLGAIFDALNALADEGRELVLGCSLPDGTRKMVSKIRHCDAACTAKAEENLATPNTPLARALLGQTGTVETKDVIGNDVLAAYLNISSVNIGIVIKVSQTYYKQSILQTLGGVLNVVNAKLEGSQELELATSDLRNGTLVVRNLTQQKFAHECQGGICNTTEYMQEAAEKCTAGVNHTNDYRGKPVVVGYMCMPKINSYVSFKVDEEEIIQEGLDLALQSANALNDNEGDSTFELELGRVKGAVVANQTVMPQDVAILTHLRFGDECPDHACNRGTAMLHALRRQTGVIDAHDYRGKEVLAALSFMDSMGIGLVNKVDMTQLLKPVIETALLLMGVSLGSLAACSYLLAMYTRVMVTSMVRAEKEGQDAIVHEKERFGKLVQSMYPAHLVGRVLAGDKQIVEKMPHAAVFFSDVYDFTFTSNRISAEKLLQLMGYVYGVMDQISDRFNVTKVKTVGDAYLAICGLPGCVTENCCLDMLHFASCCAQIFSRKFHHPEQGSVLALLTEHHSKKLAQGSSLPSASIAPSTTDGATSELPSKSVSGKSYATRSIISSAIPSSKGQAQLSDVSSRTPKSQCTMSYGIAAGPVTSGVLQGKSPMFDIWGKTVNLASRMQSTGLPGRIQVSELFYKSVISVPSLEYTFEESHSVMCKGFGVVKGYYVRSSKRPPPKDLQLSLRLEPNLGTCYYANLALGPKSQDEHGSDTQTHSVSGTSNAPAVSCMTSANGPALRHASIKVHSQLPEVSDSLAILDA